MDRLVQPKGAVAERRRGQHTQGAGQRCRLVAEDIAEHVIGQDDIERGRAAHEVHGTGVDEDIFQFDIGVSPGDFVHGAPPQAHGGQDIRFVNRCHLAAALPRGPEGDVGHSLDFGDGVVQRVVGGIARALFLTLAEVDAAG